MATEQISQEDINKAREKKEKMKKGATRWSIYGANMVAGAIGNIPVTRYNGSGIPGKESFIEGAGNWANPHVALGLALTDVIAENVPNLKNSPFYGLGIKIGSLAYFGTKAVVGAGKIISGDYEGWATLPFDVAMAYQQAMDLKGLYKKGKAEKRTIGEDIRKTGNFLKNPKKGLESLLKSKEKDSQNSSGGAQGTVNNQYQASQAQSPGKNYQTSQGKHSQETNYQASQPGNKQTK